MVVMRLGISELYDVITVLKQRGIELAYTVEQDWGLLYCPDDMTEEIGKILWEVEWLIICVCFTLNGHKRAWMQHAIDRIKDRLAKRNVS